MSVSDSAEMFAKERYGGKTRPDGVAILEHLRGVVSRLKSLGITDQEVLAAAWLCGTINDSVATFDEIDRRFGSRVGVLVLSLTQDRSVPRSEFEKRFVRQLKESPAEAKMIKLCDISTSLKDMRNSPLSKTRRSKQAKKESFYMSVMKSGLAESSAQHPGIHGLISGANEILSTYGLRPIVL